MRFATCAPASLRPDGGPPDEPDSKPTAPSEQTCDGDTHVTDIHTIVKQLTQWHVHRQPYTHELNGTTYDTHHTTEVPPLITQLAEAEVSRSGEEAGATGGKSKPTAHIEALDTLTLIDLAAARWIRDLGEDDPADTIACIRKLYSLAPSTHFCGKQKATIENRKVTCCTTHNIERDIRSWWTQARIVSGWDSLPWRPNNTCPMCSERRSLRIRSDDKTALCVTCRETWTPENLGLLAEHIRTENGEELAS